MPAFVLLVRPRGDGDPLMRVGITVSGKVGGAVVRNRMKRRLRELARAVLPEFGITGADHVLIGRAQGIERNYGLLQSELRQSLTRLQKKASFPELVEGHPFSSHAAGRKKRLTTSSDEPALSDKVGPS